MKPIAWARLIRVLGITVPCLLRIGAWSGGNYCLQRLQGHIGLEAFGRRALRRVVCQEKSNGWFRSGGECSKTLDAGEGV